MKLTEQIESIKAKIKSEKLIVEKLEIEVRNLETLSEMSILELITEFEKEKSEKITSSKSNSEYNYILGGDGRSQPWDEKRTGNVLNITTTDIYFSEENLKKLVEYIKATNSFNAIFINNKQLYPK